MAPPELDLPLAETPASRFLAWLAGGLTYLAVLAAAAAAFAHGTLLRLAERPVLVTVALPAVEDPAEAERQLAAVRALVESFPGVAWTAPVAAEEVGRLLGPRVDRNEDAQPRQALPRLLDIRFLPGAEPDLGELLRRVRSLVPTALAEETSPELSTLEELARRVRWLGAVAAVGVFLLMLVAVSAITRTSLDLHEETVGLLRLLGAPDRYVARQFERFAAFAALSGGSTGFVLALSTLFALLYLAPRFGFHLLPVEPRPLDWVLIAAVPPAAALVVTLTARIAAAIGLRRLH
ncbi:MAG: hypothetical protein RMK73_09245 [Geminicoccaceae bacterium]|nr:hypothetical protein [Geminicoccaceae bacterium]MDW8341653.1 hypothetical protein [Geminicoccaceae bacterium]